MNEEFIQEHNFNEEVIETENPLGLMLDNKVSKHLEFAKRLEKDLLYACDELSIVQTVVLASIEIEGLTMPKHQIIVEAIMSDPVKKREVLTMADRIMCQNLQ